MAVRLYWWQEKRKGGLENYGDLMSKYLAQKISKKKVITVSHPSDRIYKHIFKHYVAIGSIISSANKNSIVWGSGIIKKDDNIRNATFVAVRGPKTRERIIEKGYTCPECFGDPALLMPLYYPNKIEKKYTLGIVPHYVDYNDVFQRFKGDPTVKVINLLTTNIESTTKEILECEQIISSSLHGVIVSHAYKIPALWVKFSNKLSGDNIKFYDYYESVGISFNSEIMLSSQSLEDVELHKLMEKHSGVTLVSDDYLQKRRSDLLNSCPFIKKT